MAESLNVLVFCVDEMRADHMGCAGNPLIQTPNIDALAARGTHFPRAYCNNPICMPARASMMTGLLPRDHGLRVNGQTLRPDLPVLPGILAEAGYRTHAAGKLHLSPWVPEAAAPAPGSSPESMADWNAGRIREFPTPYYGFESVDFVGGHSAYAYGSYIPWLEARGGDRDLLGPDRALAPLTGAPQCYKMAMPEELHYNRFIADSAVRVIRESTGAQAQPFFIWCSFPDPHAPLGPPAPYCDMYDPADMPLPIRSEAEVDLLPSVYRQVLAGELKPNGVLNGAVSDAHWREMIAMTYGMITHVDAEIGRVLTALRDAGLQENTMVCFIADHGDMMGDHGLLWKAFYTFAGCIRIPLLCAVPGMPGGCVSDALVSQVDLLPSVLDLCDVPEPGATWSTRETPFERGAVLPLRLRPGHSWRGLLDGTVDAVRSSVVIENDDPTTGFQVRTLVTPTHRLSVYPGSDAGELFDLTADPNELVNIWDRETTLRDRLIRELLDEYSRCTPSYPIPPWNS
jgi:arylsulfatase A-like enzyme